MRAGGGLGHCLHQAEWSRFVTGIGIAHPIKNGFAWHRTLGVPYLPGSGVKGLTLAWARDWYGEKNCERLKKIFGEASDVPATGGKAGSVVFMDAGPCAPVTLRAEILTPHKNGSGPPEDAVAPTPSGFLSMTGSTLCFSVLPRTRCDRDRTDCGAAMKWLIEALAEIGAGAKTNTGYGRFMI